LREEKRPITKGYIVYDSICFYEFLKHAKLLNAAVLKLDYTIELPRELAKPQCSGPIPRMPNSVGLR
jgi:hypothetical protein